MKYEISWAVWNGTFAALLAVGTLRDVVWAKVIGFAIVWIIAIGSFAALRDRYHRRAAASPYFTLEGRWLMDGLFDVLVFSFLFYQRHWIVGSAYLFHAVVNQYVYSRVGKIRRKWREGSDMK